MDIAVLCNVSTISAFVFPILIVVAAVHLHGIIPIGSTFSVNPPNNSSFNWTVNMSSGTRFLLFLEDTKGNLSMSSPVE